MVCNNADQCALECADVLRYAIGNRLEDGQVGECNPIEHRPLSEDGDASLEIGWANVGYEPRFDFSEGMIPTARFLAEYARDLAVIAPRSSRRSRTFRLG